MTILKCWTLFGWRIKLDISPAPFIYRGWLCDKTETKGWRAKYRYDRQRCVLLFASSKAALKRQIDGIEQE